MAAKLKMVSISDVHLGHKNTPSSFILANLRVALSDEELSKLNIVWLAGDIFDTLLYLPDTHIGEIQLWIVYFLRQCVKYNITLRILEGTPSHDRKQSNQFIILNTIFNIDADVKYIDKLSIEYISKYNINVLYVPDEWEAETFQTQLQVKELLHHHHLKQVDYAIMHGMFGHQVIAHVPMPFHDAEFYLSIVKKYIMIGHVHQMSRFDRILVQGSFDRLNHGDESPKGYWQLEVYSDNNDNDKITFRNNHNAMVYLTINITGLTEEEVTTKLQVVKDIAVPAHIRVIMERITPNKSLVQSYKDSYVQLRWTIKNAEPKEILNHHIAPIVYTPTPINKNTILNLIMDKLTNDQVNTDVKENTIALLSSLIKEDE